MLITVLFVIDDCKLFLR